MTWPALYLLQTAFPRSTIDVLVSPVVDKFARVCPFVDDVFVDSGDDAALVHLLKSRRYDEAVALHSPWRICKLLKKAQIPYTLGPKLNWYQFLYKDRASIRYLRSEPCWRGNCMLMEHLITRHGKEIPSLPERLWDVGAETVRWKRFYGQHGNERLVFVHAGTGGSGRTLSVDGFAELVTRIHRQAAVACNVVLTFSGEERALAIALRRQLVANGVRADLARPLSDLGEFARSLVAADLFIAGSTGPLFIAGLHDVPTAGFYVARRSRADIRWQTLSQAGKRLEFTPPIGRRIGRDLSLVDIKHAANVIAGFLDTHYREVHDRRLPRSIALNRGESVSGFPRSA